MKAKLIKNTDGYYLDTGNPSDGLHLACYPWSIDKQKLSKENCDEIFGVVDVEKLAEVRYPNEVGYAVSDSNFRIGELQDAYQDGFNKAMKLNKDKVFTLEDIMNCWNKALKFQEHKETLGEYIQSLQQPTEIEVEIEMEVVPDFYPRPDEDGSVFTSNKKEQPKLDSEGCLILKKI